MESLLIWIFFKICSLFQSVYEYLELCSHQSFHRMHIKCNRNNKVLISEDIYNRFANFKLLRKGGVIVIFRFEFCDFQMFGDLFTMICHIVLTECVSVIVLKYLEGANYSNLPITNLCTLVLFIS